MIPQERGEIYLRPGEIYFGPAAGRIRTLLGSCVAITLWHPGRRIGGMCHYVLPYRAHKPSLRGLDGRYGQEAVALLLAGIEREATRPFEYVVKLFGGARMFGRRASAHGRDDIPERNVEYGRALLEEHGFRIVAEDIGGFRHRNLVLDLESGDVWVKRSSASHQARGK